MPQRTKLQMPPDVPDRTCLPSRSHTCTPVTLYKMTLPYLHLSQKTIHMETWPRCHPYKQHPSDPVPLYKMTIPYLHPVPRNHPDGDLHWTYPLVPAFFKNLEESLEES